MLKPIQMTVNFKGVEVAEVCPRCETYTIGLWVKPNKKRNGHFICCSCNKVSPVNAK